MQKAAILVLTPLFLSTIYFWQWKGRIPDDTVYLSIAVATTGAALLAFLSTTKRPVPLTAAIITGVIATVYTLLMNTFHLGAIDSVLAIAMPIIACAAWAVVANHVGTLYITQSAKKT